MKKLLAVVLLVVVVSAASFAQVTANATATANVNAVITVTRTADLALGNVNQGGTVTVLSKGVGAAAFTVAGAASAATTCTFTFPANLTNGGNNLPFTGQIPTSNTVATQASSTAFGTLTGGAATTSATGQLFLWVGGGVTASASQAAGSYTGQITVAVTQP
jgi:hypothetical protein